ncbi:MULTISPECIES: C10 family peptidase [unclassified Myroides]|uniref:C10 family peptidase n=1 Tax=unclassified Myroides TaxID=2642485 RepID=UPI003D2F76A7
MFFILSCSSDENRREEEKGFSETEYFVSSEMAKSVALSFLGTPQHGHDTSQSNKAESIPDFENRDIDKVLVIRDEDNVIVLYVVTFLPKGYIVVSGTRKEIPILGYALDVIFDMDHIPVGLADWFINRMEKIQMLNYTEGMEIPSNVMEEWNRNIPLEGDDNPPYSADPIFVEVAPLLQTQWGQGKGYNNFSPEFNCSGEWKKAPAGCVATAIAQVMKYHEFPSSYNWQIMSNEVSDSNLPDAYEISRLMRDIGTAVGMEYDCEISQAQARNILNVFKNGYGYAQSISSTDYNPDILAIELRNNRPVIMFGKHKKTTTGLGMFKKTKYSEGHVWVCDGFRETIYRTVYDYGTPYERIVSTPGGKLFHMNWGWSGVGSDDASNNNGWFRYDDFEIKEVHRNDGNNANYQYEKKMFIGIKP